MAEPYASASRGERGPFVDTRGQEGTLRDTTATHAESPEQTNRSRKRVCKKIVQAERCKWEMIERQSRSGCSHVLLNHQ